MLKNYLKIALRSILRHKAYSFINIAGLSIGMASSILILLWVQHELSFDRWHKDSAQTYRITCNAGDFRAAVNPAGMPGGLQSELPVIRNTLRISHQVTALFETGVRKFEEKRVFYADSTFLQVFSFPLVKGDARTALMRPDGVLLTEEAAKKYFGQDNPLGKTLRKDNGSNVVVTGVLANVPSNTHLQFDVILPMSAIANTRDLTERTWENFNYYSYLVLDKHFEATPANLARLQHQMDEIYKKHEKDLKVSFQLQPLADIHLYSSGLQVDLPMHGNAQYVNIFFVVAIFILVVACINFMNLATARSARRAKEVGLRKVVGAVRGQLIGQFLGESLLISFFSLVAAIGLVYLLLPLFNQLAGKTLSIHLGDGKIWAGLLGIAILTGLFSGSYPALFLSGFQPVKVLKGNLRTLGGNRLFRNGLVVMQFIVSIVLLVGTVVIYDQLTYIKRMNLGFDRENLLYMPMKGEIWGKQKALRDELQRDQYTNRWAVISDLPTDLVSGTIDVDWPGKPPKTQIVFPSMDVSENFFDVFQTKLLSGRVFSTAFKADSNNYVLNQTCARVMGMTPESAIGKTISFGGTKGMVVGVVADFHFKPIQTAIEPLVIRLNRWGGTVVVRARSGATEATISALGKISRGLNPAYPFSYGFLDQELANQYKGEQQMGSIFNLFAVLAIFISCLGLYGLSAYMAEQRTKEIGVRKVLGASLFNILRLLSTDFTRLILVATVIAIPLSWWAVNSWLRSFAYHIHVGWAIFVVAPLAALIIAWITVSFESIKAGVANPATSLRSE